MDNDVQKRISLRVIDANVRGRLRATFEELEQRLNIDGLSVALYTVIMELIGNAVKANLKRVYFKKHDYSLTDEASYKAGVAAFKKDYDQIVRDEYIRVLEDLDLVVTVEVDLDHDRLLTFVENNAIMIAEEERRIRGKLAAAMESPALVDFCLQYGDDMEGSGLGLAMIVFLIRELGFHPENFRVYLEKGRTVARVEFPLTASYKTLRQEHREKKWD